MPVYTAVLSCLSHHLLLLCCCAFISPTKNQCVISPTQQIKHVWLPLYQGPKENEQEVNCTYLYQEKPLRSVFKEYLPVPVPRETFDIRYPYQEKPLRSVFKEYLPVPVPRETFDIRYPF